MLFLGEIFYGVFKIVYTIISDHLWQFIVCDCIKLQLPHCSLSCESRMRSSLTLILSHFFAASRVSLSDLFIQLCGSLTAQATMRKLYIKTMLKRKCKTTQQQYQLYVDELENNMFFRNNKNM
jgi:hypothetical protein